LGACLLGKAYTSIARIPDAVRVGPGKTKLDHYREL
jgi:hypothetical protein